MASPGSRPTYRPAPAIANAPSSRPSSTTATSWRSATHSVFLIGAPIALLPFALTWFLKDLPLRGHAYITADDAPPRGSTPDTPQNAAKL
jgi:hypothetical protein